MKVIKRNGSEVEFNPRKITDAISAANNEVDEKDRLSKMELNGITSSVIGHCYEYGRAVNVEEIQEIVETQLMEFGKYEVAKRYIRYRYDRNLKREQNTTDASILSLIEQNNEEIKQENSNKNPTVVSVQRDYMAGEVSKDLTRRFFLPKDIVDAHDNGLIHFHDADYFAQNMHNCDLVNLEDMLQNGTVISGTLIEKPHSFSTACNIATQIIAQVASSQYGGQSISLAHLAPFVQSSREKFYEKHKVLLDRMETWEYDEFIERLVKEDIVRGVQTIQYQVVTLMTTNGQAPFITVYMDINEVPEGQTREDLAAIIEEVLKQRIQGVKNEVGVWVTPAFP